MDDNKKMIISQCIEVISDPPNPVGYAKHYFKTWFLKQIASGSQPSDIDIDEFIDSIPLALFDNENPYQKYIDHFEKILEADDDKSEGLKPILKPKNRKKR